MPLDPEQLAMLQQDPAFANLLGGSQGQKFLSAAAAVSPQAQEWESTVMSEFGSVPGTGFGLPGGPGEQGGPEGAAMATTLASQGISTTDEYAVAPSGKIMYRNGVIYDPTTGAIQTPPNKVVPGTLAYRKKVMEWDKSKVEQWRDRLLDLGYEVGNKGGVDQEFVGAIEQYHLDRYANFGKVIPKVASDGRKREAREAYDISAVDERIRNAFREVAGDDPTEREMQPFRREWLQAFREARKEGLDPTAAQAKADAEGGEAMRTDPTLSYIGEEQEEEEDGRAFMTSVFQALEGLA